MDESFEKEQGEEVEPVNEVPSEAVPEAETREGELMVGASANQDLTLDRSLAVGAVAGRDMSTTDSLTFYSVAGRDLTYGDSLTITSVAGGQAQFEDSVSLVTISGKVNVQSGFLGIVLSPKVSLSGDSQVLLDTKRAAAFGAGFGAIFALLGWLLRRRKCC